MKNLDLRSDFKVIVNFPLIVAQTEASAAHNIQNTLRKSRLNGWLRNVQINPAEVKNFIHIGIIADGRMNLDI